MHIVPFDLIHFCIVSFSFIHPIQVSHQKTHLATIFSSFLEQSPRKSFSTHFFLILFVIKDSEKLKALCTVSFISRWICIFRNVDNIRGPFPPNSIYAYKLIARKFAMKITHTLNEVPFESHVDSYQRSADKIFLVSKGRLISALLSKQRTRISCLCSEILFAVYHTKVWNERFTFYHTFLPTGIIFKGRGGGWNTYKWTTWEDPILLRCLPFIEQLTPKIGASSLF